MVNTSSESEPGGTHSVTAFSVWLTTGQTEIIFIKIINL